MRPSLIIVFIFSIGLLKYSSAQKCEPYFPMKEGAQFEMTEYNSKDKITGKSIHKVQSRKVSGNDLECTIHMETFDKKDKLVSTNEYKVICDNGTFKYDMKLLKDNNAMEGYGNIEVSVDADFIDIPNNPLTGQKLEDGTMVIEMQSSGLNISKMTVKVYNRMVESFEKITTPAGTFDCVKISFDTETRFLFKINTQVNEWYCKDVGMVKSETYNSKGKIISKNIISSID